MINKGIFRSLGEILVDYPFPEQASKLADYIGPQVSNEMIRAAEETLGVKLPEAYLELLRISNGGFLRYCFFPTDQDNSWADGFVEIVDIKGIGYPQGLDGEFDNQQMCAEWGYPDNMVYLSGDGHTGFLLDYRACGTSGEPSVAWLDVEEEPPIDVQLAPNLGQFLERLQETEPSR